MSSDVFTSVHRPWSDMNETVVTREAVLGSNAPGREEPAQTS